MTQRDVLLRLVTALDAYFAGKGNDLEWARTVNELLAALAAAKASTTEAE